MYVQHRFVLSNYTKQYIRNLEPEFGYNGYGELIFFRTYSRYIHDEERQETWHDVVIRAIEGTLSIRKDWYIKNHISWNERRWQKFAFKFAIAMFKMYWMPPGRGLWAMGTDFVYERGAMALYNCCGYDTLILTRKGVYPIGRLAGVEVEVLSKTDTGYHWIRTKINQYGLQPLVRLTTTDDRSVVCTADHGWPLATGSIKPTSQLVAGDQLICYDSSDPVVEVARVEETNKTEDIYCCEVPVWHNFVLGNGIVTQNCSATDLGKDLATDIGWMMDCLMLGVGVGFSPTRDNSLTFKRPTKRYDFIIPDSREGWVESIVRRIHGYMKGDALPNCIFDEVRDAGLPIRGFGGVSSGPRPLKEFHYQIDELIERYMEDPYYDSVMLKTDLANLTGKCVVAGNVRRSAELGSLSIKDPTFIDLKDYRKHPYRESWGGMSNNSVDLYDDEDFERLDEIANRVKIAGEPGFKNLRNFQFGRLGKRDHVKKDLATKVNPCGRGSDFVITRFGMKRFDKIKIGDWIWSDSSWSKVTNFWSTGINKVYRYKTTASYIDLTEDHKIIYKGRRVEVKNAHSLHILAGPYEPITEHDPLTIMDGLVIGDGTITNKEVSLIIGCDDEDYYTSEIRSLIFNRQVQTTKVATTIELYEVPHTYNREIPERFITANRMKVASFLRGLYSANGSLCGNRVTLKAASLEVIRKAQLMLNSIGIRSYYTTNKAQLVDFSNGTYMCKQSYDLNISNDRHLFLESVGFLQKYKNEKLKEMIDKLGHNRKGEKEYYDIVEIEYLGEEETYDLTIDNYNHTLWCNGVNISNCGEVPLESKEVCNVDETCPTRCPTTDDWYKACEYATFYASTVSLLPTHQPATNRVVARNRRIGVSIIDVSGWKHREGVNKVTKYLREGYQIVRRTNRHQNGEAGVPESIRVTTIKPGGTVPKAVGRTPGAGYPTFKYTNRRTRVAANSPFATFLINYDLTHEPDVYDANTLVFDYPIIQGPAKPGNLVPLWQQAMDIVWLQREWADNSVSNTLYFKPKWVLSQVFATTNELVAYLESKMLNHNEYVMVLAKLHTMEEEIEVENIKIVMVYDEETDQVTSIKVYRFDPAHEEDSIEPVLSMIAPVTKSVSLLPHTPAGVYKQMPEEGLTEEEYLERVARLSKIDWTKYNGKTDGIDERYCQGDQCERIV